MRILDVVVGRTVAVVVGVAAWCRRALMSVAPRCAVLTRAAGLLHRMSARRKCCSRAQIAVLAVLERGIEAVADRNAILPRAHVNLADHAHLQVLGRRDVAVPEVRAGIGREVVIGEAAADVDGHRRVRHAVIE